MPTLAKVPHSPTLQTIPESTSRSGKGERQKTQWQTSSKQSRSDKDVQSTNEKTIPKADTNQGKERKEAKEVPVSKPVAKRVIKRQNTVRDTSSISSSPSPSPSPATTNSQSKHPTLQRRKTIAASSPSNFKDIFRSQSTRISPRNGPNEVDSERKVIFVKPRTKSWSGSSNASSNAVSSQTLTRQTSVRSPTSNQETPKTVSGQAKDIKGLSGLSNKVVTNSSGELQGVTSSSANTAAIGNSGVGEGSSGPSQGAASSSTGGAAVRKSTGSDVPYSPRGLHHKPPTFLTMTKRVTNLLRFRHLASKRSSSVTGKIDEEQIISQTEVVDNLPKTPRFSAFMSPEAQFALLKGYEDIIAEKLQDKYPECGDTIKRNKTPHHKISISEDVGRNIVVSDSGAAGRKHPSKWAGRLSNAAASTDNVSEIHGDNLDDNITETESILNSSDARSAWGEIHEGNHSTTSIPGNDSKQKPACAVLNEILNTAEGEGTTSGNTNFSPGADSSKGSNFVYQNTSSGKEEKVLTPLQSLRRMSASFTAKENLTGDEGGAENRSNPHPGHHHLSALQGKTEPVPHDRRIVLSYRLEKAMDILDAMKPVCEHPLSPRVKAFSSRQGNGSKKTAVDSSVSMQRASTPLVDFNRWTRQWAHEFKNNAVK